MQQSTESLKHRIREKEHEMLFLQQAMTAQAIARQLDCDLDARIRQVQAENRVLRQVIAEQASLTGLADKPVGPVRLPASTQDAARSDAEHYLADYARRLEMAKRRTVVKLRKRNGKPGRRGLVRDWIELYRAEGQAYGLRELINAVKMVE